MATLESIGGVGVARILSWLSGLRSSASYLFLAISVVIALAIPAFGQSLSSQSPVSLTPDQIQKLLLSNNGGQLDDSTLPSETTLQPAASLPRGSVAQSRIEKAFSARAGMPLQQFGYDQLGVGRAVTTPQMGSLQDDYVLGPGDQIVVSLRGQENAEYRAQVDRGGQVLLPRLSPIAAAGRTFGEFKADLLAAIHRAYVATDAFISVGKLRQISVFVVGDVANPGTRILTGQSTPVDAILLSNGVSKTGSLRQIKLVRNGRSIPIDLYSVIGQHGIANNIHLADGDRIVIPPIGATVAVAGDVRRPGIYELAPGAEAIGSHELIGLGGGAEIRGAYRESILRIRPDGKQELVDTSRAPSGLVRDGEILFLNKSVNVAIGNVSLKGAVRLSGQYPLDRVRTLHDLLNSPEVFAPAPYMLLGLIDRIDPKTLQREVLAFSPIHVLEGKENLELISGDVVYVFSPAEIRLFLQASSRTNSFADRNFKNAPGQYSNSQSGSSQRDDDQNQDDQHVEDRDPVSDQQDNGEEAGLNNQRNQDGDADQAIAALQTQRSRAPRDTSEAATSLDQTALPQASVRENGCAPADKMAGNCEYSSAAPGSATGNNYDLGSTQPGQTLASLIDTLSDTDFDYFQRVLGDFRVRIDGALRIPGPYLIAPGTTLAELIAAAGGLDSDADTGALEITSTEFDIAAGQSHTERRIIRISPASFDTVSLEPRDEINIHKIFSDRERGEISIAGEVRYPGTYAFLRGEHVSQLLARAGGLTDVAYPYGTVYLRDSLAKTEQAGNERIASELEQQLLGGTLSSRSSRTQNVDAGTIAELERLISEIRSRKAVGRMALVADPSVLAANPDKDPLLEAGDTVFIPQRPSTVSVLGDVHNPGSYQYDPKKSASDYIQDAGGYDQNAMDSMTYIVLPDGTARPVSRSWIDLNSDAIPPGSVVFVPRDIFPIDWLGLATTLGTILQSFAVTAASLAVIAKN